MQGAQPDGSQACDPGPAVLLVPWCHSPSAQPPLTPGTWLKPPEKGRGGPGRTIRKENARKWTHFSGSWEEQSARPAPSLT